MLVFNIKDDDSFFIKELAEATLLALNANLITKDEARSLIFKEVNE